MTFTAWDDDVIYSTYAILQQMTLATYYNNQSRIVNLRRTAEMLIESGPRKTDGWLTRLEQEGGL